MKQTELGEIPVEWDVVELIDVLELQRGFDLPVQHRIKGSYPLIASNGKIDNHNEWKVKGPTIVTGRSGTIGKVYFEENDCWPLNTTLYVKQMNGNFPRFLYFLLLDLDLKQYSTGTGVPTLNRNIVHKHKVALPPLPEQQKIAKILSTVDEKIAVIDEQLAKTTELKTGLMQRLLTKGIGHTEFKDSSLGEIPKGWEVHTFGDLFTLKHGYAFEGESFTQVKNEYLLLTPGNFHPDGGIKFVWRKQKYYTGFVPEAYVLATGSLIVAMTDLTQDCNILGSPAIIPDADFKFLHNQRLGLVELKNAQQLDIKFLYHTLNFKPYRKHMRATKTGTTVSHTSPKTIYSFVTSLPPLVEQHQIANILTTVDEKIQVLHDKKAHYQTLKRGLMQQLLTGKLRVSVAEDVILA
ncbi:restriction endonuclease subunit S [Spirosoma arboris]|nr:restriction endonuclease subunit S [Spirosoma arboris]